MKEFWNLLYNKIGTEWGFEPSDSAIVASEIFSNRGYKEVLIPGIGYGRNISPFTDKGMYISGIEISGEAIKLMKKTDLVKEIYEGSVLDMPFSKVKYDAVFSYALLHLFDYYERRKIISACYNQLKDGGMMIFSVSSADDKKNKGRLIGRNRFVQSNSMKVFYYDDSSIQKEFSKFGLTEIRDIEEPIKFMNDEPPMKFKFIVCLKSDSY